MTQTDEQNLTKFFHFASQTDEASESKWQAFIQTRDNQEELALIRKIARETDLESFLDFIINDESPPLALTEEELAILRGGAQVDYNFGRACGQAMKLWR